jgi:hypothetical protein
VGVWKRRTKPVYIIDDRYLTVERYTINSLESGFSGADYLIEENGALYLIPDETLDDYGRLALAQTIRVVP